MHFLTFACITQIRRLNADKEFACLFAAYDNASGAPRKTAQSAFSLIVRHCYVRAPVRVWRTYARTYVPMWEGVRPCFLSTATSRRSPRVFHLLLNILVDYVARN